MAIAFDSLLMPFCSFLTSSPNMSISQRPSALEGSPVGIIKSNLIGQSIVPIDMQQHLINLIPTPPRHNSSKRNHLPILARNLMQSDRIVLRIELRSGHLEFLFDCHLPGLEIVLVAFIVDEDIVDVEHECGCFEHLVCAWMDWAEFVGHWELECIAILDVLVI